MTKTQTKVEHKFQTCNHVIKRKETEPAPRECPICRREAQRNESHMCKVDPASICTCDQYDTNERCGRHG